MVEKIEKRAEEIANKKAETPEVIEIDQMGMDFDDPNNMASLNDLGLYNKDKEGQSPTKGVRDLKDGDDKEDAELFNIQ